MWIILAWTLCLAVGYTLVGRLSDIFGRRWFFIGASLCATMGCIIGATASHINQLIAGSAFIGLATAAQLSFNYIITELVPMKDRFYVLALVFLFAIPFSAFGPVISRLLIVHTSAGWRWDYYMNIIISKLRLTGTVQVKPCAKILQMACRLFYTSSSTIHRTSTSCTVGSDRNGRRSKISILEG